MKASGLPLRRFFSFSRYLNFCLHFLVMEQNDWKDKVNFKFYDVTGCSTNNCNTHFAQYLEKQRQLDNEIWSVTRI